MKNIALFILTIALFGTCITPYDADTAIEGGQIVVDGILITGNGPNYVFVGRTADKERVPYGLQGCIVKLIDDTDGTSEFYVPADTVGYYRLDGSAMKGQPGHTYHIEVTMSDGTRLVSEPEKMPEIVKIDSVKGVVTQEARLNGYDVVKKEWVLTSRVYANINSPDPVYLRWYSDDIHYFTELPQPPFNNFKVCYVPGRSRTQTNVLFNAAAGSSALTNFPVAVRELDDEFFFRHAMNVYQYAITPKAHDYFNKINLISNQTGSIFDTPPAPIEGNIKAESEEDQMILGFFSVAAVDTGRYYTYRFDFPFWVKDFCRYDMNYTFPTSCFNCLELSGATLSRPYWWTE